MDERFNFQIIHSIATRRSQVSKALQNIPGRRRRWIIKIIWDKHMIRT